MLLRKKLRNNLGRVSIEQFVHNVDFLLEEIGKWGIIVPNSVYPPREDTELICSVLPQLTTKNGKAFEVGCGSGIVSIVLASLGWEVTACDVNPMAVAATRGNVELNGLSDRVKVLESGIGEGALIPEKTDLLLWNIPYLDRIEELPEGIGEIEEASMSDIPNGGWGGELLSQISQGESAIANKLVVILLMRTDPEGESKVSDWHARGWSSRSLNFKRMGGEKIEVFGLWKTGSGVEAKWLDSCNSTMDEASKITEGGWQRVFSSKQTEGRGRGGSQWISQPESVSATWNLEGGILGEVSPGLLQTSIGATVSRCLDARMKWPNDIVSDDWRKMGGILLESSDNKKIRVGVGINKFSFEEGAVKGSGWMETIGNSGSEEVFEKIDCALSSLFEVNPIIGPLSEEYLVEISWNALSLLLSEGAMVSIEGEIMRPIGINLSGELEAIGSEGVVSIGDLDVVKWLH
ncbi:MAG: hypothetical protein CMB67_04235 [Euryarchaeota archaeon]|nr:hypothetical protein [Euryarchaeota archaeon]